MAGEVSIALKIKRYDWLNIKINKKTINSVMDGYPDSAW